MTRKEASSLDDKLNKQHDLKTAWQHKAVDMNEQNLPVLS